MKRPTKVVHALLEAVWFMRWNKSKTAMYAVLEPEEAEKIVDDVFKQLDLAGYEIKRKGPKKPRKIKWSSPGQY